MRRARVSLALAAVWALCLAAPALAQNGQREIGSGETLRGSLAEGDQKAGDETFYDLYRFRAEAGKSYVVVLESDEFDPFLTITGPGGFNESDDDGGEGVGSRLELSPTSAGVFEIRANSLEKETGGYSISVAEVRHSGDKARPITMGQSTRGSLSANSPRYKEGTGYESFTFDGQAGARVSIEMTSDVFDTYLVLRRQGSQTEVASDDDSAGDLNSRITVTLPETGAYEIVATSVTAGDTGAFMLALGDGPKRVRPNAQAIGYGQIRLGELEPTDGVDEKDHLYDLYEFTGRSGERVVIHLASDDFDPLLMLVRSDTGEVISTDDDGGEGPLDARIQIALPRDGAYQVRAASVEGMEGGDYILGLGLGVGRNP